MIDTLTRVTDEFRRMDNELAAAVILPAVDAVIRRTSTANRASTAAAAAVLTVGSLGGITAIAQAGPSNPPVAAELPAPGIAVAPTPASTEPVLTGEITEQGPAVGSAVPRQRARVAPAPKAPAGAPAVEPTPDPEQPPATDDRRDDDTEGTPDSSKSPTSKPRPTSTKPTETSEPPTTTPAPTPTDSGGAPGGTG